MNRPRFLALLPLIALSGCKAVVLHPFGDVALQQRDVLLESTGLMLLVIVPVMALTIVFAWRYRQTNAGARYEPDWEHSTQLELLIWGAPLLIIICLGALTWMGTHLLDPYRPLDRIAEGQKVAPGTKPLEVDVVALDWKWLFIYPQYRIATVNELAAPVDRPIDFRITSSSVMNSFYIPALAGQIYAMSGMETKLHAVMNHVGTFEGFSANYSGAGFSGMRFSFHSLAPAAFDQWIAGIKAGGGSLGRDEYLTLQRPSENDPPHGYAAVDPSLYNAVLNMCVEPGKMCQSEMMSIDAHGGLGLKGITNVLPLEYDKYARPGSAFGTPRSYVVGLCAPAGTPHTAALSPLPAAAPATPPLRGAGLSPPGAETRKASWRLSGIASNS